MGYVVTVAHGLPDEIRLGAVESVGCCGGAVPDFFDLLPETLLVGTCKFLLYPILVFVGHGILYRLDTPFEFRLRDGPAFHHFGVVLLDCPKSVEKFRVIALVDDPRL